ncbi:MAG: class I SAM-dependent methyltransferase [Ilumatobacteraceae bacterium]
MTTPQRAPHDPDRFDAAYYRRFYGRGGVHDAERIAHLATGVHEMAAWWGIPIRSVLDVGAGTGMWRDWYHVTHPTVRVASIDVSDYACATWGHQRRDIAQWRPGRPFDLVVCHGVLHYIDNAHVEQAIVNLAAATRHVLYLELPTTADLRDIVDPDRTDLQAHRRTGTWYRRRLEVYFRQIGAGLWVPRGGVPMFELEAAGR